jgi:midasin
MERGDDTPVTRHPNFRIFAAMNPPTDTSKRDLPPALRSRFTEIYVSEPKDKQDLRMIACASLGSAAETSADTADGGGLPAKCVDLYESCRKRARDLEDGAGQHPHYSLRSLCRALRAASNLVRTKKFNLKRALYEGFCSSFATQLTPAGAKTIQDRVLKAFFGSAKKGASQDLDHPPPRPGKRAEDWELVDPFWLGAGPLPRVDWAKVGSDESSPQFIVTPSVQQSLRHLARAVAVSDAPVLLQGPTSAGKTTLVEYLATRCGHRCVRINNHEHTDLQEYLGIYTTDGNGKLAFHEVSILSATEAEVMGGK